MADQVKILWLLILYNICYGLAPYQLQRTPIKTNK